MHEPTSVLVIGAGQAGLATGYWLQQRGHEFTIVAADERIGDTWRNRWDSLELFTPAFYNGLPGLPFPADDPEYLPTKDEMADYLETYAETFDLPVELATRVTRLARDGETYVIETDRGERTAQQVIVATGAHTMPWRPSFATELPETIFACHSSGYRNPEQLATGDVLVVGAGNSGTQIATELSETFPARTVWLAGRDTGRVPRRLLGRDIYRWLGPTILRINRSSFIGRRLHARSADVGDPVFADEIERMEAAGVTRVGRITGIEDGRPQTADGQTLEVGTVIWATGFHHHYPWIELDIFRDSGEPRHRRGIVAEEPGLYFVGLRWQSRLSSSLIGGVGRDAKHVVETIDRSLSP